MWKFVCLGQFLVFRHNHILTRFRTQKTASLLAYLALHPRPQSCEHLIETFWPDAGFEQGRMSLRSALAALRRQLEPVGTPTNSVLCANRTFVRLLQVETDVAALDVALKRGDDALTVELYCGELLPGFYDDWIVALRTHHELRFRLAAERHINTLLLANSVEAAEICAHRVARLVPDWNAAEAGFAELLPHFSVVETPKRARPLTEQKSADSMETHSVLARAQSQNEFGNWPATHGRLFGRENEIEELLDAWQNGVSRVLTLTGAGGVGKTRLSLETLARLRARLTGTGAICAFAPLAQVSQPELLFQALLEAVATPRLPNVGALESLLQALRGKPAFLVLDNCEHLLPQLVVPLQKLVAQSPDVRLLLSSRARLELAQQQEFPVAPLDFPVQGATLALDATLEHAGVALFVDRAQWAKPDFALTAGNAATIVALCARLEGLPLAIELLAARASVLSPRQMLAQLEESFTLLQTSQRQVVPRHRSLWAAIRWSYELLPPELARFWRQLSVFRGGFSAAAAAAIAGEPYALHRLSQLRAASLIGVAERAGEMRFSLLQSFREFGQLQLSAVENRELASRHAAFYSSYAQSWTAELNGPQSLLATEQLDAETGNLRAALVWSRQQAPAIYRQLAANLWPYWEIKGTFDEGQKHLEAALNSSALGEESLRVAALNGLGKLCFLQGDFGGGIVALNQSRELSLEIGDKSGHAVALLHLGIIEIYRGNGPVAIESLQSCLTRFEALEDVPHRVRALTYRGVAALVGEFKPDSARDYYARAIGLARQTGDDAALAYALFCMGDSFALASNQYQKAVPYFEESLQLVEARADRTAIAYARWGLGYVALSEARYDEANALFNQVLDAFQELFQQWAVAFLVGSFSHLAAQQGEIRRAVTLSGAAAAMHEQLAMPLPAHYRAEYERWLQPARAAFSEKEFAAIFARGRVLTPEKLRKLLQTSGERRDRECGKIHL